MAAPGLSAFLVGEGILSKDLAQWIARDYSSGPSFVRLILSLGLVSQEQLFDVVSRHSQIPLWKETCSTEPAAVGSIELPLQRFLEVVPARLDPPYLKVYMADPFDPMGLSQLRFFTSYRIRPIMAKLESIHQALKTLGVSPLITHSPLMDILSKNSFKKNVKNQYHSINPNIMSSVNQVLCQLVGTPFADQKKIIENSWKFLGIDCIAFKNLQNPSISWGWGMIKSAPQKTIKWGWTKISEEGEWMFSNGRWSLYGYFPKNIMIHSTLRFLLSKMIDQLSQ